MMNSLSMMRLVNGNSCMNNMRLDSLFLNYRLNVFMNMVVDTLASDSRGGLSRVCGAVCLSSISILGSFSIQSSSSLLVVSVMELLVLDGNQVMMVLFRAVLVSICRHMCGTGEYLAYRVSL